MAVRDEEQQPAETEIRRVLPWRETLNQAPAVLLVGGLLMYGYLSICYDRFYSSLGVDPNDVGLTYAGTLARSSGFVIVCLILFALLAIQIPAIQRGNRCTRREDATAETPRLIVVLSVLLAVALIFAAGRLPLLHAGHAARDVQQGTWVGPIQVPLGPSSIRVTLSVLAIHADPAIVQPAGKPEDFPALKYLQGRKLLYLGKSEGTVVLYDASAQSAMYLPASSIFLYVVQCRTNPRDPACSGPFGP